jgi:hypothetical protein
VNTYENDLSSESIGRCYFMACRRLDAIRGSYPVRTYSWEDEETWPKVSKVVQFPAAYVEVTAYQGNDSDGVSVRIYPGVFTLTGKCKPVPMASDQLPPGTLRYQQQ